MLNRFASNIQQAYRHMLRTVPALAILLGLSFALPARAQAVAGDDLVPPVEDLEGTEARLEIIQNRKYENLHEIAFLVGGIPVDPFFKGLTGSAGYTLHFNDSFAWEVFQFTYSYNIGTKLRDEVERVSGVLNQTVPQFPATQWIAASHLVLKPLYGKQALFNTEVVHVEVYLQGGPAFLKRTETAESMSMGVDVGFGFRLWLSKWASLRFDVLEMLYFLKNDPEQTLRLHGGIAFNLRGED